MRQRIQAKQADGFTIIETLIVLAVAGLILLIVFLAVPSLERSGRNDERKQDIATILQAVSHYELSNSGNFPLNCGGGSNKCNKVKNDNNNFLQYDYNNLTYYGRNNSAASITLQTPPLNTDEAPETSINKVEVYNFLRCSPTQTGYTTYYGADYSNVVALYALETAGRSISQCQQLD